MEPLRDGIEIARAFGSQSMVEPLRRVLVRRPDEAFAVDDPVAWNYAARPELREAQQEHDAFVALLSDAGAEVVRHDATMPGLADSVFVHDPVLVTDRGTVVLSMGKPLRRGEETALAKRLEEAGVPVAGTIGGNGHAEGGDLLWLDHDTLAVGQGFRTDADGLDQLHGILDPAEVELVPVQLPWYEGPATCLHLMSLVSLVSEDLAVVYLRLLPVPFWTLLREQGFDLLAVPDEEFATMGTNVLALAPRTCVMLEGNPVTKAKLEAAGCEVRTYRGNEISLKAEGGPTCLTRPILRGA